MTVSFSTWSSSHVEVDIARCGGTPVLRGTRFTVAQLLAEIAEGPRSAGQIAADFDLDATVVTGALCDLATFLDRSFVRCTASENICEIDDGGPAMPHWDSASNNQPGMTLRDYLAAEAMEGDWASQSDGTGEFTNTTKDAVFLARALTYYRAADAVLLARKFGAKPLPIAPNRELDLGDRG